MIRQNKLTDSWFRINYFEEIHSSGRHIDIILNTILYSFALVLQLLYNIVKPIIKVSYGLIQLWLKWANRPQHELYIGNRLSIRDLLSARKLLLTLLPVGILGVVLVYSVTVVDVILWILQNPELFTTIFVATLGVIYYILSNYHIFSIQSEYKYRLFLSKIPQSIRTLGYYSFILISTIISGVILAHVLGLIFIDTSEFLILSMFLVGIGFITASTTYNRTGIVLRELSGKEIITKTEIDSSLSNITKTYPFYWSLLIGVSSFVLLTSIILPTILYVLLATDNIGAFVFGADVGQSVTTGLQQMLHTWVEFNWYHFIVAISVILYNVWIEGTRFVISNSKSEPTKDSVFNYYNSSFNRSVSKCLVGLLILNGIVIGMFLIGGGVIGTFAIFDDVFDESEIDVTVEENALILEKIDGEEQLTNLDDIELVIEQNNIEYSSLFDDDIHSGSNPTPEHINYYKFNAFETETSDYVWLEKSEYRESNQIISLNTDVIDYDEEFEVSIIDNSRDKEIYNGKHTMEPYEFNIVAVSAYDNDPELYRSNTEINSASIESTDTVYIATQIQHNGEKPHYNTNIQYNSDSTTTDEFGRAIIPVDVENGVNNIELNTDKPFEVKNDIEIMVNNNDSE